MLLNSGINFIYSTVGFTTLSKPKYIIRSKPNISTNVKTAAMVTLFFISMLATNTKVNKTNTIAKVGFITINS